MQRRQEHWDWPLIRKRCAAEAFRILRRQHDAEEAVQEALARAWRSRASCRTPEAPLPWCLQITRNEALRTISRRRAQPDQEPIDEAGLEDARAGEDGPHTLTRIDVNRALRALTAHERLLIELRYSHDCSHAEIAERLEIPEVTARVRLHRVHKRLASML
jgi:RNA polymerase sigma-70 factor (ECF subfamily)